jgi:hypothetical protein
MSLGKDYDESGNNLFKKHCCLFIKKRDLLVVSFLFWNMASIYDEGVFVCFGCCYRCLFGQ